MILCRVTFRDAFCLIDLHGGSYRVTGTLGVKRHKRHTQVPRFIHGFASAALLPQREQVIPSPRAVARNADTRIPSPRNDVGIARDHRPLRACVSRTVRSEGIRCR